VNLLAGHRVAVASYGVSAAYAGWLLRQFGADVTHVSALDPEGLGAFLAEGGRFHQAPQLDLAPGELLVTDAPVTASNREAIERRAARSGVVWLTPWGLDTPWQDRPWSDLTLLATGGWMHAVGEPEGPPLAPPGAIPQYMAGLFAAIEALGRPAGDQSAGLSVVSMAEAVAATAIYDTVAFQYHGVSRGRVGNRFARAQCTLVTLPCLDGYLGIHAALHHQWLKLVTLIGHPEIATDPRFATLEERMQHLPELDEYLVPWLASRKRWDAYHELQAARIPCAPIPDVSEVLASPQLAARRAWHEVTTPSGRGLRVPGPPARVETGPAEPVTPREPGPWAHGRVRVVDLSMGWAGPLVSHVLACYGADVIKLESHRHFDWWRGSRPAGDDPTLSLHERSHVFNSANRGKRGVTLDAVHPEGNALVRRLIASADVVIENFGAGVLEKLGLDYLTLAADNPSLILLRQPAFGRGGPESQYAAFGNTIEGMSGLTSLVGPEGGPPYQLGNALGDPVSGLNGAVAVLAALEARSRDGLGRCVEAAQVEGFLPLVSEAFVDYQRTGTIPTRRGNRRPGPGPSGAFACAGEDAWLAVDVTGAAARSALASLLRVSVDSDLEAALVSWAAAHDRDDAAAQLAAHGIPAAPVNSELDVLYGEPFSSANFFEGMEREVVGYHLYPSLPVIAGGERRLPGGPAPLLGEHTHEVLQSLGLDSAALEALERSGVTGAVPV